MAKKSVKMQKTTKPPKKSRQSAGKMASSKTAAKKAKPKIPPNAPIDQTPVQEPNQVPENVRVVDSELAHAPGHKPMNMRKQIRPSNEDHTKTLSTTATRNFTTGDKMKITRSMRPRSISGRR